MPHKVSSPALLTCALLGGDVTGRRALAGATLVATLDLLLDGLDRGTPAEALTQELALAAALSALADETSARSAAARIVAASAGDATGETRPLATVAQALFERGGAAALELMAGLPDVAESWRRRALHADDPRLATAMARRSDLTATEQQALVERGETAVLSALAGNTAVRLERDVLQHLLARAHNHDIARALLTRGDLDRVTLLPLYRFADASQRAALRAAIAERAALRGITLQHPAVTEDGTERLLEASLLGIDALIADVCTLCGRGPAFAEALRADADRDLLALSLVALDVPAEISTRLILRAGDALSLDSRRVMATVAILRETPRTVAIAILAAQWPQAMRPDLAVNPEQAASRRAGIHQPVMASGGTAARQPPAGMPLWPSRSGQRGQRQRSVAVTVDALKTKA